MKLIMNTKLNRLKNDEFRNTLSPYLGRVVWTRTVGSGTNFRKILDAVADFKEFPEELENSSKHNFGELIVDGEHYIWTIEVNNPNHTYHGISDHRLLTIMHASEYYQSLAVGITVDLYNWAANAILQRRP